MSGPEAMRIWEKAVEPVRRERAILECTSEMVARRASAVLSVRTMMDVLRGLKLGLVDAVTRDEAGVLSEIAREYTALEKLVRGRDVA